MSPLCIAVLVVVVAITAGSVWSIASHPAIHKHTTSQHTTINPPVHSTKNHQSIDDNLGKKPAGLLISQNTSTGYVENKVQRESGSSGYVAFTTEGDVTLVLKQGTKTIAKESSQAMENDETGAVTEDSVLEAPDLAAGDYVLCIKGKAGSAFKVQTYEYKTDGSTIDVLVKGVVGPDGTYRHKFSHKR